MPTCKTQKPLFSTIVSNSSFQVAQRIRPSKNQMVLTCPLRLTSIHDSNVPGQTPPDLLRLSCQWCSDLAAANGDTQQPQQQTTNDKKHSATTKTTKSAKSTRSMTTTDIITIFISYAHMSSRMQQMTIARTLTSTTVSNHGSQNRIR